MGEHDDNLRAKTGVGLKATPTSAHVRRKVVVKFSAGVTSAWCAGWAKRTFPHDEIVLVWHDTKWEHPDTYRFKDEMVAHLGLAFVERSDGRTPEQVFEDEGFYGNNQQTPCSRILKQEQGDAYIAELQAQGFDVVLILGYSADEQRRINGAVGRAAVGANVLHPYSVRFPVVEERVTKQQTADWCTAQGVCPSEQYVDFDHANCEGCVKGAKAYWIRLSQVRPHIFNARADMEERSGHPIVRGGGREHLFLRDLVQIDLKRKVPRRERIEIGACECGD